MNRKSIKIVSFIILISYLAVSIANVVHYHDYLYNFKDLTLLKSENTQKLLSHSFENCIINQTFNSIHKFYNRSINISFSNYKAISYFLLDNFTKPQSSFFSDINSRSPPFFHS